MSKLSPTPALALALLLPLLVAGKRKESSVVGFHLEAGEADRIKHTTGVVVGTEQYRVRTKPEFNQRDIAGYYPFLASDGISFGTAFRLNEGAAKKLNALTTASAGRRLFTVVNTDTIGFVVIDGPVDDGYIVCWQGLNQKHLAQFEMSGFKKIEGRGGAAPPAGSGRGDGDDRSGDFAPLPGSATEPPLPGR